MNSLIIVFSEGVWCLLLTFWESVFEPREHRGGTVGTSGAPWDAILALRDHPGGPWEQQDGFEVANNRMLIEFGMILGRVHVTLWISKCLKNTCVWIPNNYPPS